MGALDKIFSAFSFPGTKQDRAGAGVGIPLSQKFPASEFNGLNGLWQQLRQGMQLGQMDELQNALSSAGSSLMRHFEGRRQLSEEGGDYFTLNKGRDVWDIRDLGTNVMNGNANADTAALQRACALMDCGTDSSSPKRASILFPIGDLYLNQPLLAHGQVSKGSSWIGRNGRSGGPDGTRILWQGGAYRGSMLHLMGFNHFYMRDVAFDCNGGSGAGARFGLWTESNQRNGGSGSSGIILEHCQFDGFGFMGAGWINGDEIRGTLTVSGDSGSFQPGDVCIATLDAPYKYSCFTVSSYSTGSIGAKECMNGIPTSTGTVITNLSRTGSATLVTTSVDSDYQGNRQSSEHVANHCLFQGTGIQPSDDWTKAGFAGASAFGGANNKNFTFIQPILYGTTWGLAWNFGSGYMRIHDATGGLLGNSGHGGVYMVGDSDLILSGGNFEQNTCRAMVLANCSGQVEGGGYFHTTAGANHAMIETSGSSELTLRGVRINTDDGIPRIVHGGGSMILENLAFVQDFSGYVPVYESSPTGNPLGMQGDGDYGRDNPHNLIVRGCIANSGGGLGGIRLLPDFTGKPGTALWSQFRTNNCNANSTIVRLAPGDGSPEVRTVDFNQVKANSGTVDIGRHRYRSGMRIFYHVDTAFSGGAISAVTLKVGDDTDDDCFMVSQDVHSGTGWFDAAAMYGVLNGDSHPSGMRKNNSGSDRFVRLTFGFTGAAVSALTAGQVSIYIEMSNY